MRRRGRKRRGEEEEMGFWVMGPYGVKSLIFLYLFVLPIDY
jgi:hypothetical protein